MGVGAAREHVEVVRKKLVREGIRVRAHLLLIGAEGIRRRDPEAGGLGRDRVHQRAALHPREDGAVDRLRVLLATEDEAGARPGKRLVRGRGDDVTVLDRVRMQAGGDEPGEVRHVAHQESVDLVRDPAELGGVDRARVRRPAADDQTRPMLLREREHLVVVDHVGLARDAVVRDRVEAAGEVDLEPVCEVAAVVEPEGEDRLARLEQREVRGHVRLCARMRLHVRVLGAEELLRAVDRELLDLVHDLAAAVVAASWIALGVLVRGHGADRLEHARPGEVLRRDQLDLASLPLQLALEQVGDLGVGFREPGCAEPVERGR